MRIPNVIPLGPNRVWRTYLGGRTLDALEGSENPADTYFPEDWIGSTTRANNKGREHLRDEGLSRVSLHGQKHLLTELFERNPAEILGTEHYRDYGSQTGVLVKFLDSAIRLHIQCHPTIAFAQEHLNSNAGKTEAYVILKTREEVRDPYIYMGFQNPPDIKEFRTAILEQRVDHILGCFEKIPVKPGDVFLVPGGFPHAIGEGVFMIEIMEPTDLVVRIEFERGGYVLPEGARFMGRDVDFALSMFDFNRTTVEDVHDRFFSRPRIVNEFNPDSSEASLIDERMTSCFSVRRLAVKGAIEKNEAGFYIAIVTGGSGAIESGDGAPRSLRFGDRFLVTAGAENIRYSSKDGMKLILALPPKSYGHYCQAWADGGQLAMEDELSRKRSRAPWREPKEVQKPLGGFISAKILINHNQ